MGWGTPKRNATGGVLRGEPPSHNSSIGFCSRCDLLKFMYLCDMVLFEEVKVLEKTVSAKISIIDNEFDYKYVISNFVSGVLGASVGDGVISELESSTDYLLLVVREGDSAAVIISKIK